MEVLSILFCFSNLILVLARLKINILSYQIQSSCRLLEQSIQMTMLSNHNVYRCIFVVYQNCCILFKVYKTTILRKRVLKPGLNLLSLSLFFSVKQLILLRTENTDFSRFTAIYCFRSTCIVSGMAIFYP